MGVVNEGDDVLARWSDGLLYLGNVKRVDGVKQCCLVRFEDNSEFWVLRKDIHSFSVGVEELCCICDGPPLKEPLINCLKCRHGYHSQCHTPEIEAEADSDSWICRQCVFAVATRRGGALKRGRFARLMQFMKLRLPYQLSSLDWDPQHLTNQQQCYCYCAGPGEWNLKMLQCGSCGQWFHEACTQCLTKPLLYGDRFYRFQCSVCTNGPETIQRLPMSWVDLAHLVLYHLSLCCKRKYFDFDHEILSFTNENWESLLLGELSDTPRQDRCHNLLNALNSHKDRFVSGKEIKKKKCLFGLQVRAPPPLLSDASPLIAEPPINITHRKRSDQGCCLPLSTSSFSHSLLMPLVTAMPAEGGGSGVSQVKAPHHGDTALSTRSSSQPHRSGAMLPWLCRWDEPLQLQKIRGGVDVGFPSEENVCPLPPLLQWLSAPVQSPASLQCGGPLQTPASLPSVQPLTIPSPARAAVGPVSLTLPA
ncbi:PHD finger protein 1 isoform X3 [Clupea harengus]|uniref:PHD finger protein 1 isoform X3 n=1 Tax=Clupea harengus TaxID=7950 RepID=A0A6P8FX58_CLUHA|nr:PHD finger protein 1 isoform X3 [Clupea harengus]